MGRFSPGLAIASTLAATGLFLAASNLIASLRFVQSWSFGGVLIAVSLLFLLSAAGLGLALALNLVFPYFSSDHISWLKVHAHLALVGWLGSVVMGATHKLIPMFTLGPEPPAKTSAGAAALVFGGCSSSSRRGGESRPPPSGPSAPSRSSRARERTQPFS